MCNGNMLRLLLNKNKYTHIQLIQAVWPQYHEIIPGNWMRPSLRNPNVCIIVWCKSGTSACLIRPYLKFS